MFKGCTFAGYTVSTSGQATNENHYENCIQDLLHGIDAIENFND